MEIDYDILVDHIRKQMTKSGISKMGDLAEMLDISASTLSNNIRYVSRVNNFETPFFDKLLKVLDITKNEFIEKIKSDIKANRNQEETLKNEQVDVRRINRDYYHSLVETLSSLSEGDTYTLVTTEIPFEFIGYESYKDGIVQSLMSGAQFIYIFPENGNEEFSKDFKKYWPKPLDAWKELEDLYNKFIDDIYDEYHSSGNSVFSSKKSLSSKLICKKTTDPYLLHPFFKFMWLHKDIKKHSKKKDIVYVEYRVGDPDSLDIRDNFRLWYPLPEIEAKKVQTQIQQISQ